MIITGKNDYNIDVYKGIFTIDREGIAKTIFDNLIVDINIAKLRAKAEFVKSSNTEYVEITTHYNEFKIGDIVEVYAPSKRIPNDLNNRFFKIIYVSHFVENGVMLTKIKAVRYD